MAISHDQYQSMIKRAERLGVDRAQLTVWADGSSLDRIKAYVHGQIMRKLDAVEQRRQDDTDGIVRPAAGTPMATDRQVAYAAALLSRHEGGGYVSTQGLVVDGRVDTRRLAAMSRSDISMLIDSLRGTY